MANQTPLFNIVEQLLLRADTLDEKFAQTGERRYIDDAIAFNRGALAICSPYGSAGRHVCLTQLTLHLTNRYVQLGMEEDLDEVTLLDREALSLCPPGHPNRPLSLNNLASDLRTRHTKLGRVKDLDEATSLDREALSLCPPGHPDRSKSLSSLSTDLATRYKQLGMTEDLHEATLLDREALSLCPPEHPERSMLLNNLAVDLKTSYRHLGKVEDLNEATLLDREALSLRQPGHQYRASSLINLAVDLSTRYEQLGRIEDLNEAIQLNREALLLHPPGHRDRSMSLNNLAANLNTRYKQLRTAEDLDEATLLHREALLLCQPGHLDRPSSLLNLASDLRDRYNQLGRMEDLDEATLLDREALSLRPLGHSHRSLPLTNLAADLGIRYRRLEMPEDLGEAALLLQEALSLCQLGDPGRSKLLRNLAHVLRIWYDLVGDSNNLECIFSLYTELADRAANAVSFDDLSTAKQWIDTAEDFCHPTMLIAYETALRFLTQHLATLPSLPQHISFLKSLTSSLAADAFSACLRNSSPAEAVELLEQGRGVFWSQLTRLRSPIDDVAASCPAGKALAEEFTCLTSAIRNAFHLPEAADHDSVYNLSLKLQSVVSNIRRLPGLSRFLLPSLFSDLRRATSGGPVIIVNASTYGCDALIVSIDKDPIHIPLSITKENVLELSSKLQKLNLRAKRLDISRDFALFLRELWDNVVSPIADVLQTTCPINSRVWWCPTAEFSLLPLHAAAPYRNGQPGFATLYVSSYTPTLTALIRARRSNFSSPGSEPTRFIAIGQADADGKSPLPSVGAELDSISHCVNRHATLTRIEGQASCISRVMEELGKNAWVHLACHGVPDRQQPFASAFVLYDGPLTIHRLLGCELANPEFAYLSACHTTVGDEESPDEVIHLASAMQFAGFRSVIGTMWAVDDGETNKIVPMFYKLMVDESGRLDYTRAARALRKTMWSVTDVPLDQRALYIHIGA